MTTTPSFDATNAQPLFELRAGATGQFELTVASVRGREGLSRLYRFDVTFAAEIEGNLLRRDLLGKPAELSLLSPALGTYRRIRGVVAALTAMGSRDDRGRIHYVLRLVPRAWLLRQRRDSRIFQGMTVVDVVNRVLDEHNVQRQWKTVRKYGKRDYCVQYQETDYQFVTRLLAEDGIFFYFEERAQCMDVAPKGAAGPLPWEQDEEVMILGDGADAYAPIQADEGDSAYRQTGATGAAVQGTASVRSPPTVPFRAMGGGLGDEHISTFQRVSSVKPAAVRHHDYDFERPMLDLAVSTATPVGGGDGPTDMPIVLPEGAPHHEFYEHHGDHSNVDDARDRAEVRLEQLRRKATTSKGEGNCRRLAPGHTFRLEGHIEPQLDGDHVVTKVFHEGFSPGRVVGNSERPVYTCRFECAPARLPYRPAAPARKLIRAVESAVVVGPDDEAIYTDEYGRIKVQFHWDRKGLRDEQSSCWIRVAHPWAGAGWGFQFIPRVGNEVIVSFLGGDPDRPVVVGSLYNRIQMPPFPLPFAKTRSGIRTSSPAGGNELSFEDDAGNEQIRLFACRDLDEEVARHASRVVKGSETSSVKGSRKATVEGDDHCTVLGTRGVTVGGNRAVDIQGDEALTIAGNTNLRHGGDVEIDTTGDLRQTVGGAATARLQGPLRVEAAGDVSTNVEGHHRLTVGVDGTGNTSTTFVFGTMSMSATGSIELRADEEITLTCGQTSLRLTPEKLEALGRALHIVGSDETLVMGGKASHLLQDDVEIAAETVSLFSSGGSLELTDSEARLGGSKVKLGQPQSGKSKSLDAPPDPEKKTVKWRFADVAFKPYAGKKYHLLTCGQRFEGQTDGDGVVTADIPKEARSAEVILWVGDYPTGLRRRYPIVIADELPDPTTSPGARVRLHALGYEVGLHSPNPWAATNDAVHQFQVDHAESDGLKVSGELDEATKLAIQRVFGS